MNSFIWEEWHGDRYNQRGEQQLSEYLDYFNLNKDTPLFNYVEKNIKPGEKLYFTAYFIQGSEYDLYYNYDLHFMENPELSNVSSPQYLTESFLNQAFDECEATKMIYMFTDKKYANRMGLYRLSMLINVGKYYIYKINVTTPTD